MPAGRTRIMGGLRAVAAVAAMLAATPVAAAGAPSAAAAASPAASPSPASEASLAPGPGSFVAMTPVRLLDTRAGIGAPRAAVGARATVHLQVTHTRGLPTTGVSAVVLNVTVTAPTRSGVITVYPDGTARPTASNLNFVAGQSVPNLVVAPVGANGKVDLYNGSSGTTALIADVSGYFVAGASPGPGGFASLHPTRLLDTRIGLGAVKRPVSGRETVHLQVTAHGGVPSTGVSAVVLNVTVTAPTRSGVITVYPDGTARPTASNLNFVAGQSVPNLVVAPVGANGKVDLYNGSSGTTALIADVSGYFVAGASPGPGGFTSLRPTRLLDTRIGLGVPTAAAVPANGTVHLRVTGRGGIPLSMVGAVVLNVTVTGPAKDGYATVYADGTTRPVASNLNFVKGQTVPNLVVAPVGAGGRVALTNVSSGTVSLVADVSGYLLAQPALRWTPPVAVDPVTGYGNLVSVSCPAATFCAAVDLSGNVTMWDGSKWSAPTPLAVGAALLSAVSCASVTTCMAVDEDGGSYTFDGTRWSGPAMMHPVSWITAVSCPTTTFCVAVDAAGYALVHSGSGWRAPAQIGMNASVSSVSCASPTFCVAVNDQGLASVFRGSGWTAARAVDARHDLASVSCPTPTFCAAVGSLGDAVTFDGTTWGSPARVLADGWMTGVSCDSATSCVAVDQTGQSAAFDGTAWGPAEKADTIGGGLTSVSCAGGAHCVAVDVLGYAMTWSSGTWSDRAPVDVDNRVVSVSCASDTFCAAVDQAGQALLFDGTTWGAPTTIDTSAPMQSVSCPTDTFCAAVDALGSLATYDGSGWGPLVDLAPGDLLTSLSCSSPAFCAAVGLRLTGPDIGGLAATYDGTSWTTVQNPTDAAPTSVSCPSDGFCMAVDGFANEVVTFDGTMWSGPVTLTNSDFPGAVSCSSATFCVLGADTGTGTGTVQVFDGTGWGDSMAVTDDSPSALECASSQECLLGTQSGTVVTYDGRGWTRTTPIAAGAVTALSCAGEAFCVGFDEYGNATTGRMG